MLAPNPGRAPPVPYNFVEEVPIKCTAFSNFRWAPHLHRCVLHYCWTAVLSRDDHFRHHPLRLWYCLAYPRQLHQVQLPNWLRWQTLRSWCRWIQLCLFRQRARYRSIKFLFRIEESASLLAQRQPIQNSNATCPRLLAASSAAYLASK